MIADVDADLPSFCPTTGRRAHIYRNTGVVGTTMLDEIGEIIPNGSLGATFDFAPIDINGDGWKDLVIGRCAGIELWINMPPIGLTFAYPAGHPSSVTQGVATNVNVNVSVVGGGPIVAGSLKLNYRISGGAWELGDPVGTNTGGVPVNPENDNTASPGVSCWVTDNGAVGGAVATNDVDNGPVNLISPALPVATNAVITCTYAAWAYCNDSALPAEADFLTVQYSFDGGGSWITGRQIGTTGSTWQQFTDVVGPATGATVIVRFSASDLGNNSNSDFGVDSFSLTRTNCSTTPPCTGDLNQDGLVTCADFPFLLQAVINGAPYCADLNHDGLVNSSDYAAFHVLIGSGDSDGDLWPDSCDNCPSTSNFSQLNTDGDAVGDACDGCPNDPLKTSPGTCGCGVPDTDSDGDGTPNCNDGCPNDPLKTVPGTCGCGVSDIDSDNDGVPNCIDGCPTDPNKIAPGACGCGVADLDADGDGVLDCVDLCPNDPNKSAPGTCGCGTADTDSDNDGVPDCVDLCPGFPDGVDCNDNGVPDGCDLTGPGASGDINGNGVPDECECVADLNNDSVTDGADLAVLLGSWGTSGPGDINADGTTDGADLAILLGG